MESWSELVNIFGTATATGVLGMWVRSEIQSKKELKDSTDIERVDSLKRNSELTDSVSDSEKATIKLLTEMQMVMASLTGAIDKLPEELRKVLQLELIELKATMKSIKDDLDKRHPG
jgi:hypothetical protein